MPKIQFQTVACVGRPNLQQHRGYFLRLARFLRTRGKTVILGKEIAKIIGWKTVSERFISKHADLILVFGGDGTFLSAARRLYGARGRFLGVRLGGTLGFLTEQEAKRITQTLTDLLRGKFQVDNRLLLEVSVKRSDKIIRRFHALNEAVINQSSLARLIRLDFALDQKKITTYLADGVILGTPTGSTAYSLSAGGPIVYSSLPVLVLTPINPHILANRPLVLPANRTITARISDEKVSLTLDGQVTFNLRPNDEVIFRKADWELPVIYSKKRNYFEILRTKLNWGERS